VVFVSFGIATVFFLSFLKVCFEEILPRFIFFVVEGRDVFGCDFQYYEFPHIYIGFGDKLQLFSWHTDESWASFIDCKCPLVDILVVYFCRAIYENAPNDWV